MPPRGRRVAGTATATPAVGPADRTGAVGSWPPVLLRSPATATIVTRTTAAAPASTPAARRRRGHAVGRAPEGAQRRGACLVSTVRGRLPCPAGACRLSRRHRRGYGRRGRRRDRHRRGRGRRGCRSRLGRRGGHGFHHEGGVRRGVEDDGEVAGHGGGRGRPATGPARRPDGDEAAAAGTGDAHGRGGEVRRRRGSLVPGPVVEVLERRRHVTDGTQWARQGAATGSRRTGRGVLTRPAAGSAPPAQEGCAAVPRPPHAGQPLRRSARSRPPERDRSRCEQGRFEQGRFEQGGRQTRVIVAVAAFLRLGTGAAGAYPSSWSRCSVRRS